MRRKNALIYRVFTYYGEFLFRLCRTLKETVLECQYIKTPKSLSAQWLRDTVDVSSEPLIKTEERDRKLEISISTS